MVFSIPLWQDIKDYEMGKYKNNQWVTPLWKISKNQIFQVVERYIFLKDLTGGYNLVTFSEVSFAQMNRYKYNLLNENK